MAIADVSLLEHPVQLIAGLAIALLLGFPIQALLGWVADAVPIPRPAKVSQERWADLTTIPGRRGGRAIGHLERFLFFAFVVSGTPELIVAWLAFKVASKWEAWSNVYKIPENFPDATKYESLLARTRWGSRTFQRSIIGTAANLGAAILGLLVAYYLVRFDVCV